MRIPGMSMGLKSGYTCEYPRDMSWISLCRLGPLARKRQSGNLLAVQDRAPQFNSVQLANVGFDIVESSAANVLLLADDGRPVVMDGRVGRQSGPFVFELPVGVETPLPFRRGPCGADQMPLAVVGRHVRHDFGPVDVEDESGIVGQRQRIGLVVGCVREDGPVILLVQRADPAC